MQNIIEFITAKLPIVLLVVGIISFLATRQPYNSSPLAVHIVWYALAVLGILLSFFWPVTQTGPQNGLTSFLSYGFAIGLPLLFAISLVGMINFGVVNNLQSWQFFWTILGIGAVTSVMNGIAIGLIWQWFVLPRLLTVYAPASSIVLGAITAGAWLTLTIYTNELLYTNTRLFVTIATYFAFSCLLFLTANLLMYAGTRWLPILILMAGIMTVVHALNTAYLTGSISGSPVPPLLIWIIILACAAAVLWRQSAIQLQIEATFAGITALGIVALIGAIWIYQSDTMMQRRVARFLQTTSMFNQNVDWETVSSDSSVADLLEQLNDPHALFFPAEEAQSLNDGGDGNNFGFVALNPSQQVAAVYDDSPAAQAGIQPGDKIISVNNTPLEPSEERSRIKFQNVTTTMEIQLERDGEPYTVKLEAGPFSFSRLPRTKMISDCVAYIEIPATLNPPTEYHTLVREFLTETDQETCGYIIDLRRNNGGNIFGMMAAIGSIAGQDTLASVVLPDGEIQPYQYVNGQAMLGNRTVRGEETDELTRQRLDRPVVVLTSPITGSSGEITAILFKGRDKTNFIGEPTGGVPTATTFAWLSNGAKLGVTGASIADRDGNIYPSAPIVPDTIIETDWSTFAESDDTVIVAALDWIQSQQD